MKGNLRALISISLPIMLFLFCETLTLFCERIFLSYHSIDAVAASLSAGYLAAIFQIPCMAIGTTTQVFIGLYQGSREYERIGSCVWQLIWFSLLSSFVTIPLSFLVSSWYFKDTLIQKAGVEYFTILALGNFLFPLSTTLSSFYLGRGKTFFVTTVMLASYALNLLLSWLLIFGIGMIPTLGAKGAALAKCMSLGMVCCVLFGSFLTRKSRELYQTNLWKFSPTALWYYVRPGMVRAFGSLAIKVSWVAISYIMIKKGGEYLDVLTLGGTVITFLIFIATGMYRAILTIASNLIGAKENREMGKLCRSFIVYILGIFAILSLPLIFFPNTLLYFFDSSSQEIFKQTFKEINHWIWLYLFALTLQLSFCAILVSSRDLKYQMYGYFFLWTVAFIPVYFGLNLRNWPADKLWMIMALENIVYILFFVIRLRQKKWEERQPLPS